MEGRDAPPSPLLHVATGVTWLVIAAHALRLVERGVAPWHLLGAVGLFGAAYLGAHAARLGERTVAALVGLQSAAALWAAQASGGGIEAALLVVTAGQVPFLISERAALAWVLGQCALLAAIDCAREGRVGLLSALPFAGFQVFALGAARLAEREQRARRALARANGELVATQELLAGASRVGERLRIARDLHDALGHHLTALSLNLELAARTATDGKSAEAIARGREMARELLAELRQAVGELRTQGVDLQPALAALVSGIPEPRIDLTIEPDLVVASPLAAHALFACVQEVVTNTLRHAGARTLSIALKRSGGGVSVEARDDGRGAAAVQPGSGLAGMRERIEQAGGRLQVESAAGAGFAVRAWLPA